MENEDWLFFLNEEENRTKDIDLGIIISLGGNRLSGHISSALITELLGSLPSNINLR